MQREREYYQPLAAAYIRGKLAAVAGELYPELFQPALAALSSEEKERLVELAREYELRIHRFKRTLELPRVQKILGILKGIQPANLLDIGSGRGAFLWPLLAAWPDLPVTCLDLLEYRVNDLQAVHAGGITHLTALQGDVTKLPFGGRSFDVVTMLEVLEHLPVPRLALAEVCRVARRFVLLSVPSRADDNPEHLHLFTQADIKALLAELGITRVRFEYVLNHLIAIIRIE
jgi:2-polyprenyl-3-methyl-5-hydroxy-6-metoxy-1,4-benzoquinol methylase